MIAAVTSKTGQYKWNWKKICFFACMCVLASGFLFPPLWKKETIVRPLAGVVFGLAGGGIFSEVFTSSEH